MAFIENLDKGFKPDLQKQPCNTVSSYFRNVPMPHSDVFEFFFYSSVTVKV